MTGRRTEDLAFIERIEIIEGSLAIRDNPDLIDLPEWSSLLHIGGSLAITHNRALSAVRGFPVLQELSGDLYVAENPALHDFLLGAAVVTAKSLYFALNSSLERLGGMQGLASVEGDVRFAHNAKLTSLQFPSLNSVGGDFLLVGNSALQTADFSSLHSARAWLIMDNAALMSLSDFSALEHAALAVIDNNDALEEIVWTASNTTRLSIRGNAQLSKITGSGSALTTDNHLFIEHNPELRHIEGFAGASELQTLRIDDNNELYEITGLSALRRIGVLQITRNLALSGPPGWLPELSEATSEVAIFGNLGLEPGTVEALLARVTFPGVPRVGDNKGQDTALDPCPWPGDGLCDATWGNHGPGTGLCLEDPEDCDV